MASNLLAMASNLLAMASNLLAMASNLVAGMLRRFAVEMPTSYTTVYHGLPYAVPSRENTKTHVPPSFISVSAFAIIGLRVSVKSFHLESASNWQAASACDFKNDLHEVSNDSDPTINS